MGYARRKLQAEGYDSVVVSFDAWADVDADSRLTKDLRRLFGHSQVIVLSSDAAAPASADADPGAGTPPPQAAFDDATYQQARPVFARVLEQMQEDGHSLPEFFAQARQRWGSEITPYLRRFRDDLAASSRPEPAPPSSPPSALPPEGSPEVRRETVTTQTGTRIGTHFAVVEGRSLITSNDDVGNVNPDFPPDLQPRERDRTGLQSQVDRISSTSLGEKPEVLTE
jgi:hypothetical protein